MIDIEAARARMAWLDKLQPGDPVEMRTPFGVRAAVVVGMSPSRIHVEWRTPGIGNTTTWVHRDTGDLPGNRTSIEPPSPAFREDLGGGWDAA